MLQLQLSLLARRSLRLALLCLPRGIFRVVALSRHGGHDPPRRPRFPIEATTWEKEASRQAMFGEAMEFGWYPDG